MQHVVGALQSLQQSGVRMVCKLSRCLYYNEKMDYYEQMENE